jgi:hypothetical protein
MFYLKNLSSVEIFDDVKPWDWDSTKLGLVPQECFADKTARDTWINKPATQYHVYSLYVGVQGNIRIRKSKQDGDDNPPLLMYGLVVDYDLPMSVEHVKLRLPKMGEVLPMYFEQTLSGNGRLIWIFQEPIRIASRAFLVHLLKHIRDLFPIDSFPGIDEKALLNPEQYFTNGARWTKLQPWTVPTALLRGWIIEQQTKFSFSRREHGKAVSRHRGGM